MEPNNKDISLDFSNPNKDVILDFSTPQQNVPLDFSEVEPKQSFFTRNIIEMPNDKTLRLSKERKDRGIKKAKWTLEKEVEEDIARRKNVAKGSLKGLASGASFGISDKWVSAPESDEEAKAYDIGNLFGSVLPVTVAEKAIVAPIVFLAGQTGKASKFLQPLARLAGWGGVGATEETIKSAVEKGELPTKEDVLKKGAAYAGIDAVIQSMGAGAQFAKKIENMSESGLSKKEVINEIVETIKGKRKGVTDWAKVEPEIIMESTQEVEQKLLGMDKTIDSGLKPPEGLPPEAPIPVNDTENGLVIQGTRKPVPKDTPYVDIERDEIEPFSKSKDKVDVKYVPPAKGTPREQIAEHVALEPPQERKDVFTKNEFIRQTYDDLHPLKVLAEQAAANPEKNPYFLANIARNFEGRANAVLEYGQYDYLTKKFSGPGIVQIFSKDAIKGIPNFNHTDLKYYLVAGSSLDRQALGQINPIPTEAATTFLKENQKYFPVAKQLVEFSEQGFLNEKNNGWWSESEFANAKENYKSYVPLYRYIENESTRLPSKKSFKPQSIRKQAKGSRKKILDPIQSIVKNAVIREQAMAKNDVMNAARDALESLGYKAEGGEPILVPKQDLQKIMGETYEVTDAQVPFLSKAKEFYGKDAFMSKDGSIYGYRDGKKWIIHDVPKDIVQAIDSMGAMDKNALEKIGKSIVRFYSMVRVGVPSTQLRIIAQDAFLSAFTSNTLMPIVGPFQQFFIDWPVAMFEIFSNKDIYQDFLLSGAANKAIARDVGADRIVKTTADLTKESSMVKKSYAKFVGDYIKRIMKSYPETLDKMSTAVKLAEYKRTLKQGGGKVEAAQNALEMSLNYSKKGAMRSINMLKNFVPWLNTIILDTGKIVEVAVTPGTKRFENLVVNSAALSLFGLWYYANTRKDKRFQALTDREKNMYYYFYTTNDPHEEPLKLRRFWLHGALSSSFGESMAEFIEKRDPKAFLSTLETAWDEINPMIKGNSQPLNARVAKLDNELQLTRSTSETAKATSKFLNSFLPENSTVTPLFVDYWIAATFARFGTVGSRLLDDYVVATDKKDQRPEDRLADSFWLATFFGRGPKKSTSHLENYYKQYDINQKHMLSEKAYRNQGKTKEANEYAKNHPWIDMSQSQKIIKAKLIQIDSLFASKKYTPKQKREVLEKEYIKLADLFEHFYEKAKNDTERKNDKK